MDVEIYSSSSEEQTHRFGVNFSLRLVPGDVVAFYGDLGAGKTEFIKGICIGMHVEEIVSSPTYTIVNQYTGEDRKDRRVEISHIDLYRLTSQSELAEIGLEEILGDPASIKLIEWAEFCEPVLPQARYEIHFYGVEHDNERRIEVIHRSADTQMVPVAGSIGGRR